ncbi:MAG: hypothetical protein ACI9Y1_001785 [Lentisphaeria bacterium]|jgi:hypothetical protein
MESDIKTFKLARISPIIIVASILLMGFGAGVNAQATSLQEENRFFGSFYIESKLVGNATEVSDDAPKVEETQMSYGATIDSLWRTNLSELSLIYDVREAKYPKNSQPDDTYWDGESGLKVGNDTSFYGAALNHSIRRILDDPASSRSILANTQAREITSGFAFVRTRNDNANVLSVAFNVAQVDIEDSIENDSKRNGFDLIYTRHISSTRELNFIFGERDIEYNDVSELANYKTESATLKFGVLHRTFDYIVQFGVTKIKPAVGSTNSEPTVDLQLNTRLSGSTLNIFASRTITDSSLGNQNSAFFSSEISFDGTSLDPDQVKSTSAGIAWLFELMCERCSVSLNAGVEDSDYINLSINDSKRVTGDVTFVYEFTSQLSASFTSSSSKANFSDPLSTRATSQITTLGAGVNYIANRQLTLEMRLQQEKRDTNSEELSVGSVSLRATYAFD